MRGLLKTIGVFIGALVGGTSIAAASPWGQSSLNYLIIQRTEQYESSAENRSFDQSSAQVYGELGVGAKLTLGVNAIYAQQDTFVGDRITDRREGFTTAEVFVQRPLWSSNRHIISAQFLYAASATVTSAADREVVEQDPATQIAALYGYGADNWFATASSGYRHSLGDDASFWRSSTTFGARQGPFLLLLEADDARAVDSPFGARNVYEVTTVGASLVMPLPKKMKLQIGARTDVHGVGLDEGESLFVALWQGRGQD